MNKLNQIPKSCVTAVSSSRFLGKTDSFVLAMIPILKKGERIIVAGCKDPKDITERLKGYGIIVKNEPSAYTQSMKSIYNENSIDGEFLGFEKGKVLQTGFVFYCY